jgi:hypothetical protein
MSDLGTEDGPYEGEDGQERQPEGGQSSEGGFGGESENQQSNF